MRGSIDWAGIESAVLSQLLPFQMRTVDWAFHRLYEASASDSSGRFLVADETGLGKTLVAKAVVARALKYLEGRVDRADVVYICSNAEIAAQNLARLKIDGLPSSSFQSQGRLTLLPLLRNSKTGGSRQRALSESGINFLALTPSTSLDVKNDVGQALERALMCRMIQEADFNGVSATRWRNLFANRSTAEAFEADLRRIDQSYSIDQDLLARFLKRLRKNKSLTNELFKLTESFSYKGKFNNRDAQVQEAARRVIGELRSELAKVCITALEPDLVILDEFQRFPRLLDSQDEDSVLAQQLFNYPDVRLLMLSATPYRLWADEVEDPSGVGHYKEFLRTIRFLLRDDEEAIERISENLSAFNLLLRRVAQGDLGAEAELASCRGAIEQQLSSVISRTDRVPATEERDAMVRSLRTDVAPAASDFIAYAGIQQVAAELKQPDMLEYWRSAPYPMSFLSTYKVRGDLLAAIEAPSDALLRAVQVNGLFMPSGPIPAAEIPNARTRHLAQELIGAGLHRIPWIPPSLPHYKLGGWFAVIGGGARTKRLIFSSWKMVPRAVSSVLDAAFADALRQEGVRPAGRRHEVRGNDFALGYACRVFARDFHPLDLSHELSAQGVEPTPAAMQSRAELRLGSQLAELMAQYGDSESSIVDASWYWLGPLLLDLCDAGVSLIESRAAIEDALCVDTTQESLIAAGLGAWPDDEGDRRASRLALSVGVFTGERQLGRMPADLSAVLARLAIAGPATCALRSFGELPDEMDSVGRGAATSLALALLGYLGNEQMVGQLEREYSEEPAFWRRVLRLCVDGCWSAVLDEYVAVLGHDRPKISDDTDRTRSWLTMPARIAEVLSLKPSVLRPEKVELHEGSIALQASPVTLRHARPLLEREAGESIGDGASSMTELRNAFNSPFMPFVLSSTSIGQEGLDFHWYCHAIMHWNVPGTPVDFEQRDGRIHRFRNHAVRRNLAHDWAGKAQQMKAHGAVMQWQAMFGAATESLIGRGADMQGMKPSWIYRRGDSVDAKSSPSWMTTQQGDAAEIERHVPTMAHSRDWERYAEMTRAIGCYRLVFAQPRQEDLLSHLLRAQTTHALVLRSTDLAINLRPPAVVAIESTGVKRLPPAQATS